MQLRSFACGLGLAVLASSVPAQGKVIVVDSTGAGDFVDLRAAVTISAWWFEFENRVATLSRSPCNARATIRSPQPSIA